MTKKNNYHPTFFSVMLCLMVIWAAIFFVRLNNVKMQSLRPAEQSPALDLVVTLVADTFVSSGREQERNESSPFVAVGYEPVGNYKKLRTLLRFSLNDIPQGSQIREATLGLYLFDAAGPNAPMNITAHRISASWNENINWLEHEPIADKRTGSTVTTVGLDKQWYFWNVQAFVEAWVSEGRPLQGLGIILIGDETETQNQRTFRSKDCTASVCINQYPYLRIVYEIPTATPTVTDTPTPTPTPSATPSPTPGIKVITLRSSPAEEILAGHFITYTIDIQNGPFPLSQIIVQNLIPEQLELVAGSIQAPLAWATRVEARTISFALPTLAISDTARLSYRALRHTPTATPTNTPTATPTLVPTTVEPSTPPTNTPSATATTTLTPQITTFPTGSLTPTATITPTIMTTPMPGTRKLLITKAGPPSVAAGGYINYALTVTNLSTTTLTGLTIFDLIPVGGEVVDLGGGATTMPPSQMIQWQVPLINPHSYVVRSFTIRNNANVNQIVNNLYFVDVIEGGILKLRAVGEAPVVTTISAPFTLDWINEDAFAPLNASLIINEGAMIQWQYPGFNGQARSNSVRNPPFRLYLPIIR